MVIVSDFTQSKLHCLSMDGLIEDKSKYSSI